MDRRQLDTAPVAEQSVSAYDETVIPWAEARRALAEARTFWLGTVRPDGQPHVRPHLAVWVDDALHFTSSTASRKGKNLVRDAYCAVTTQSRDLELVVEGEAVDVTDEARLQRVADSSRSSPRRYSASARGPRPAGASSWGDDRSRLRLPQTHNRADARTCSAPAYESSFGRMPCRDH